MAPCVKRNLARAANDDAHSRVAARHLASRAREMTRAETIDVVLGAVADACALRPKRHADIVDALDALRASVADGSFDALGAEGSATASDGALRDAQTEVLLPPLRAAMESGSSAVIAAALGAAQTLLARGLVVGRATRAGATLDAVESSSDVLERRERGEARAEGVEDARDAGDAGRGDAAPETTTESTRAEEIIDAVCGAGDVRDVAVELQVLKTVLTAVSSRAFEVHDRALLRVVRTCYNIYLASKSEVNQNTAKATLTQMLTTVFHRLETDDPHATAPAVVVADVLRPVGADAEVNGVTAMSAAVQSFINKVTTDMNSVGSFSYFTDPDDVVKTDSVEHAITKGEFDDDTAPMTPNRVTETLAPFSPGGSSPVRANDGSAASELETDAFIVFRSLCKLAKKASTDLTNAASNRSKVLSLQLLKIIIENTGDTFSSSPRFTDAVREYLCDAIVTNASTGVHEAYQLSCSIFLTLLTRYRAYLKAEIGFFFPMLLLKPLELTEGTPLSAYNQRATLVKGLQVICGDAQLMVDLFVNFDCDLDGQNLFERCVLSLVRIAQGVDVGHAGGPEAARESVLKVEALECLDTLVGAIGEWTSARLDPRAGVAGEAVTAESTEVGYSTPLKTSKSVDKDLGHSLAKLKADKREFQEGITLFNKKAKKGLAHLQSIGRLGESFDEIAEFLRATPGLDKTVIGDYLGERDEPMIKVMHAYVDAMDFTSLTLDDAIRKFLEGFRLPGESQKIDRLMEKFAERYHKQNPTVYKSADTAYVLSFSVIMLNTDAHNPQVKNKMTKEGFIRNNRGIDDGQDLPSEVLEELYDRIVNNEIKLKEPAEAALNVNEKKDKNNFSARLGMDVFFSLMSGKRKEETVQIDTADLISQVRAQAATMKGFLKVEEAVCAKPMLELIWNPILSLLGAAFEDTESAGVVSRCLESFRRIIRLTSLLGMYESRDTFITALVKLTSLHNAGNMRAKHVSAVKTLVRAAIENGNELGEMWTTILACVSKYEHVYALANGFNDSSLFSDSAHDEDESARAHARPRLFRKSVSSAAAVAKQAPRKSLSSTEASTISPESTATAEQADEKLDLHGFDNLSPPNRMILTELHPDELAHLFHASVNLNGEAIVEFVRCLCELAIQETSSSSPRAYSLGKIVEVASFNMDRIRLIWARVWQVLSDFFVVVGCSPNLKISMMVVDSLRQLAMKFLSRTELANYSFQNEFLRPFVVVMRQSPAVEIRELIIRCVSQMVQARVSHIKSGWKSMFMVFTTAAADEDGQIVTLAFQTIERIIREHFHYIIETDTVAFTDCVNCLVAFTNSEAGSEVCLNALAFLRFCALKLAEGALGDLEETAATEKQLAADGAVEVTPSKSTVATTCFTDAEAHTYFWFPLLAGLSELAFDPRSEIRTSALEVLFDTLKFHGGSFTPGFWTRVYSRILFPIFDHVRADIVPQRRGDDDYEIASEDIDDWLYGTCTRCLELVVDLAVQFHQAVVDAGVIPDLLKLLCGLASRAHEQLAACGVVAFKRLLINGAPLMKEREWHQCMEALQKAFDETTPNFGVFSDETTDGDATRAAIISVKTQTLLVSAANDLSTEATSSRASFNVDTLFVLLDVLEGVYTKAAVASRQLTSLTDEPDAETRAYVDDTEPLILGLEAHASALMLRTLGQLQGDGVVARTEQLVRVAALALENYLQFDAANPYIDVRQSVRVHAQVSVDALDAVCALDPSRFKSNLPKLYPLLTSLIRRDDKPNELSQALGDVFVHRVGPILAEANDEVVVHPSPVEPL